MIFVNVKTHYSTTSYQWQNLRNKFVHFQANLKTCALTFCRKLNNQLTVTFCCMSRSGVMLRNWWFTILLERDVEGSNISWLRTSLFFGKLSLILDIKYIILGKNVQIDFIMLCLETVHFIPETQTYYISRKISILISVNVIHFNAFFLMSKDVIYAQYGYMPRITYYCLNLSTQISVLFKNNLEYSSFVPVSKYHKNVVSHPLLVHISISYDKSL